jgi:hypothetical protein
MFRRKRGARIFTPPLPPGVHSYWSTTYIEPNPDPKPGSPTAREPGMRVRVVPNETLLPGALGHHLGELTQALVDEGADVGIAIELDTSDRTRPGEHRTGASPIESISLLLMATAAGFAGRQLERLGDRLFDAAVGWVLRHRRADEDQPDLDPIAVTLFGPDGNPIKSVLVPQGQGDAPPEPRHVED